MSMPGAAADLRGSTGLTARPADRLCLDCRRSPVGSGGFFCDGCTGDAIAALDRSDRVALSALAAAARVRPADIAAALLRGHLSEIRRTGLAIDGSSLTRLASLARKFRRRA